MARRHALHQFLQSAALFGRGQATPVGDQLLELGLIDGAGARTARVITISGRRTRRIGALGWTLAGLLAAFGALIARAVAGRAIAGLAVAGFVLVLVLV